MKRFVLLWMWGCSHLVAALTHFPGGCEEILLDKKETIQLLTWNIWGLPNDLVAVRPWEERVDGIAQTILKVDPDVVILEECFQKGLSLGLYERLKQNYAHVYLDLESDSLRPSGLVLFSKLPVDQFQFTPHGDLIDLSCNANMGILDFVLLNKRGNSIAHIAGSHFLGTSVCEWRTGITQEGTRLSYAEVRQQEANRALTLLSNSPTIPCYLCGDLNVDRRSTEFLDSPLHPFNSMSPSMCIQGTCTSFLRHKKALEERFPNLALSYQALCSQKLQPQLTLAPWDEPIASFDPAYLSLLEGEIDLSSLEESMLWDYFTITALEAIAHEKNLWQKHGNPGQAPPVTIKRVLETQVFPTEEALDYVLGVSPSAIVVNIQILKGYYDDCADKSLSDHHPVVATLRVRE